MTVRPVGIVTTPVVWKPEEKASLTVSEKSGREMTLVCIKVAGDH